MGEKQMVYSFRQAENAFRQADIRSVIFDMDGTLYHQGPVRFRMALRLAAFYGTHPHRLRELAGIRHFRRIREEEAFRTVPMEAQIQEAARRAGLRDREALKKAIRRWMFDAPLREIARHPRKDVISSLRRWQAEGRRILIYSDYAAEDKAAALGLRPDAIYYPGVAGIKEMKPSPESMRIILDREGLRPDQAVMIGDRMEKDGKSAELAGTNFILVQ